MQRGSDFYSILTNQDELAKITNYVNSQFDNTAWRSFMMWDTPQIDLTFGTLLKDYSISPMASVIDSNAPKPEIGGDGFNTYYDSMPTIGLATSLKKNDFRNIASLQASGLGDAEMLDKLYGSVEKVVRGAHNRINQMVFSGLTSGAIAITASNNPTGILFNLDLRIPSTNKVKAGFNQTTKAAWTDTTNSDPVQDLIDLYQKSVDEKHPFGVFYMSLARWNAFCKHPKVQAWIRARLDILNTTRAISSMEVRNELAGFDLPPIVVVENKFTQMVDGQSVAITDGFDTNIVVGAPIGMVGTIKNAIPASLLSGIPSTADAAFTYLENNRFALLSKWDAMAISHKVELEANLVPTINVPYNIYTLDTSQAAS